MIRSPIYQRRGLFRTRAIKFASSQGTNGEPNRTATAPEEVIKKGASGEFEKDTMNNNNLPVPVLAELSAVPGGKQYGEARESTRPHDEATKEDSRGGQKFESSGKRVEDKHRPTPLMAPAKGHGYAQQTPSGLDAANVATPCGSPTGHRASGPLDSSPFAGTPVEWADRATSGQSGTTVLVAPASIPERLTEAEANAFPRGRW